MQLTHLKTHGTYRVKHTDAEVGGEERETASAWSLGEVGGCKCQIKEGV